jgi:hypothetical protein
VHLKQLCATRFSIEKPVSRDLAAAHLDARNPEMRKREPPHYPTQCGEVMNDKSENGDCSEAVYGAIQPCFSCIGIF